MPARIQLSSKFDEFLADLVASGHFASAEALVKLALSEFRCREEKLADLREISHATINPLDRGEETLVDADEALRRLFAEIRDEGERELYADR